jgi:hypothetical protein
LSGFKSKREYIAKKKLQVERERLEKEQRDLLEKIEREREVNELVEKKLQAISRHRGAIEQDEKADLSKALGGSGRHQGWGNN